MGKGDLVLQQPESYVNIPSTQMSSRDNQWPWACEGVQVNYKNNSPKDTGSFEWIIKLERADCY